MIAVLLLPVEQFPGIAPLEQEISGVDDMIYVQSQSNARVSRRSA